METTHIQLESFRQAQEYVMVQGLVESDSLDMEEEVALTAKGAQVLVLLLSTAPKSIQAFAQPIMMKAYQGYPEAIDALKERG